MNDVEAVAVDDTVGVWNGVGYTRQFKTLITYFDYDRDGLDTLRTDARGARRTQTRDAIGRTTAARDEFGIADQIVYSGAFMGSVARRNGSQTSFAYDPFGRERLRRSSGLGMASDSVLT